MKPDPASLNRFLDAQAPVYAGVLDELRRGAKTSHWMWFIFPQLRGLGSSTAAHFYGLGSLHEAAQYLEHELLGTRLRECLGLVLAIEGKSVLEVFGSPDDLKLRSCLTLFGCVAPSDQLFQLGLHRLFGGEQDVRTLALLGHVQG